MNIDLTPNELAARYQLLCRSTQVEAAKTTQVQQIGRHLQALNQLLKHDLRALARRGSPDDFADIYFALEQELERFHEFCSFPALAQKFVVAFGGGFSAGKSSLINTLLGKRLLVTEVDPTTSLPTYLLHGEPDAAYAHNLFGHRIDLSTEEFLSLTHDEVQRYGSNISRLLRSAFITRADFPWSNLALIDTPGYTKHEDQNQGARTDEHIARTQLNAAQAIVWVIDARKGCITEDDLQFLASMQADIPRLIVVSRADQKPTEEISAIVQGIKVTLSERNLPFMDVIPVSARKKQEWPMEPILKQLAAWSRQPRTLRFAHNFKAQFTRYARFIEEEQRQAQRHLNRLNRILVMAENQDVQADAEELKQQAEYGLAAAKERTTELLGLRHQFFSELKAIGDAVGIALPEPSEIDLLDIQGTDLLKLLTEQRAQEGRSTPDEPQALRDLMNEGDTTKLLSLIGNGLAAQLNSHIAAGLDAHSRETYARLLAAVFIAQGVVSDAQSQLFKALLGTLQLDDIRSSLFAQAKSLNQEVLCECRRILQEHELAKSSLVDALILCRVGQPLKASQVQLLAEMANYLEIGREEFLGLIELAGYVLGLSQDESCFEGDTTPFNAWGILIPLTDAEARIILAKRAGLPEYLQSKLASDEDEKVIIALAKNPCLHEKFQSKFARNGSPDVKKAISENSCITEEIQNYLLTTSGDEIKKCLANNTALVLPIQSIFSEDLDWNIRCALAKNTSLQHELSLKLAEDDDSSVRAAIAGNPNSSEELQVKMARDEWKRVRSSLARNTSLQQKLSLKLSEDDDIDIRADIAGNPSSSEALQVKMARDESKVRIALASNPSLSSVLFSKLVNDDDIDVRKEIACNPFISESLQAYLVKDAKEILVSLATNKCLATAQQFKLFEKSDADITINLFRNTCLNKVLKKKIVFSFSESDLSSAKDNLDYCKKLKIDSSNDLIEAYGEHMNKMAYEITNSIFLEGKSDSEKLYESATAYDNLKSKEVELALNKFNFIELMLKKQKDNNFIKKLY